MPKLDVCAPGVGADWHGPAVGETWVRGAGRVPGWFQQGFILAKTLVMVLGDLGLPPAFVILSQGLRTDLSDPAPVLLKAFFSIHIVSNSLLFGIVREPSIWSCITSLHRLR